MQADNGVGVTTKFYKLVDGGSDELLYVTDVVSEDVEVRNNSVVGDTLFVNASNEETNPDNEQPFGSFAFAIHPQSTGDDVDYPYVREYLEYSGDGVFEEGVFSGAKAYLVGEEEGLGVKLYAAEPDGSNLELVRQCINEEFDSSAQAHHRVHARGAVEVGGKLYINVAYYDSDNDSGSSYLVISDENKANFDILKIDDSKEAENILAGENFIFIEMAAGGGDSYMSRFDIETQEITSLGPLESRYSSPVVKGDRVYVVSSSADSGDELHVSNESGTAFDLVGDLNLDSSYNNGDSNPGDLTLVGDHLFFSADASDGREVYVSTGDPDDEITCLGDINTEVGGAHMPALFVRFGEFVYFAASSTQVPDSLDNYWHENNELWRVPLTALGDGSTDDGSTDGGSTDGGRSTTGDTGSLQPIALPQNSVSAGVPNLREMSAEELAGMAVEFFVGLTKKKLKSISARALSGLTTDQVDALPKRALRGLKADQLAQLSEEAVASLSRSQIKVLSPQSVAGFSRSQVAELTPKAVKGFNADHLTQLPRSTFKALETVQLAKLSRDAVTGLTSGQLRTLSGAEIAAFKPSRIKSLDADSISGFKPSTLDDFSRRQVKALSDDQLAGLSKRQIKKADEFVDALSGRQRDALSLDPGRSNRLVDPLADQDDLSLLPGLDSLA